MEELANLFHGFAVALQPFNVGVMLLGIVLGVLIGVLPGLGGYGWALITAIALGVPLFAFLVFERWFLVPLPKGPIEALLGF